MPVWYYVVALVLILLVGIIVCSALMKVRLGHYTKASVFGRSPAESPSPSVAVVKVMVPIAMVFILAATKGNVSGEALAVIGGGMFAFAVFVHRAARRRTSGQTSSE